MSHTVASHGGGVTLFFAPQHGVSMVFRAADFRQDCAQQTLTHKLKKKKGRERKKEIVLFIYGTVQLQIILLN
jgi:hypothetical protein